VDTDIDKALEHLLESKHPASILAVSPNQPASLARYAAQQQEVLFTHVVFEDLDRSLCGIGRYEFALVCDTLEHLEKSHAEQLLGRVKDVHAELLWISVPDHDDVTRFGRHEAIAQGMRRVNLQAVGGEFRLYEFSLNFYKPAPQWLNADNWANPQLWNKRRW